MDLTIPPEKGLIVEGELEEKNQGGGRGNRSNMEDKNFETVPFKARDGYDCNLLHYLQQPPGSSKGTVLLVHGAGVRSNIFNPPTKRNLIHMLAEAGYDVWLENWRGSIDLKPNHWDLDQVALFDHPAAVEKVVERTGAKRIKAIIHCQGSTSFMISAALGLVPHVDLIISNAVSLHPVVPRYSVIKLKLFLPFIGLLFNHLNPQWGIRPADLKSRILQYLVRLTHFENDTTVGKFVSFTYGAGFPALWELDNLDERTKEWIQREFAFVPLSFFYHIRKCVKAKKLVANGRIDSVPKNYTDQFLSDARVVLFGGGLNKCFLAEGQERTYEYLNNLKADHHKFYRLPNYSHLDVFLGKNSHTDVFPLMIKELNHSL